MCLLYKVQIDNRRFKSWNYLEKWKLTNGHCGANYRRITVVKLSPCQQRALHRLRPLQQTATFYGISPTDSFRFVMKSDTARLSQLTFWAGKDSRESERLRLPFPVSWIHSTTPSCASPPHSATQPLSHSSTLFLFPLLTFTPEPVAVYRHSISVAPLDKRNFSSHLRAECYFRGSWQTQKSQSPSCQWQAPPLLWRPPPRPLPPSLCLSLSSITRTHKHWYFCLCKDKMHAILSSKNNYNWKR